jgi:hypothetical protein
MEATEDAECYISRLPWPSFRGFRPFRASVIAVYILRHV